MADPELMIGPVAEALGVGRGWLLGTDQPLHENIDLPVSLMVELMDAAEALYPTAEQRWRQLRQWLSRLTGRPVAEFAGAAPLMLAVRRQFRRSRDEDLQAVVVWRRRQPAAAAGLSQLQLTVRPENGERLRRLVQQLGSQEAAVEFLLQMDDNCGKGAAQRRTRWPPKVYYESNRGQVKIDVGTEMVCVVLSQFKPAPQTKPTEPPHAEPPAQEAAPALVQPAAEPPTVNGHEAEPARSAAAPVAVTTASAAAAAAALPLTSSSAYGTVVRDATLPAQMFADDDLAADQLAEVQEQLTSVLDKLADDDSNPVVEVGDVTEEIVGVTDQVGAVSQQQQEAAPAAADSGVEKEGGNSAMVGEVPPPPDQMPSATDQMPETTEEMPETTEEIPATTEEMTAVTEEMPATTEEMSAATDEMPAAADEMPAMTDEMPAATDVMPAAADEIPATTEEVSAATDEMPAATEEMPEMTGEMAQTLEIPAATALVDEEMAEGAEVHMSDATAEEVSELTTGGQAAADYASDNTAAATAAAADDQRELNGALAARIEQIADGAAGEQQQLMTEQQLGEEQQMAELPDQLMASSADEQSIVTSDDGCASAAFTENQPVPEAGEPMDVVSEDT